MRLTTITMAAAVGLALVTGTAACDREQTGAADQTQASPTHTGHTPDMGETPGHHDPYKEAAEKFALPQQRIIEATIAATLTMLERGGPIGDQLAGTDPDPEPLNQGGHLDPAVLSVFTTHLQVPADQRSGRRVRACSTARKPSPTTSTLCPSRSRYSRQPSCPHRMQQAMKNL